MKIGLSKISSQKSYIYLALSALFLVILMLSPMLNSGYIADDSLNSLTRGYLLERHESLFNFTYNIVKMWITQVGRFFPLAFYMSAFYTIITNLLLYKLIILLFVILNIALFGYFINILTESKYLGIMAISLAPIFFQMRLYHDAILGYHLLLELVFLYVITSLIFLIFYLRTKKKKYLILSLFIYILGLMTYEIVYPFFILYFVIIYFNSRIRNLSYMIKLSLPYAISSALFILITVFLRMYVGLQLIGTHGGSNYIPNFSPNDFFLTLLKQIFAAFPFSYYIADPNNIFEHSIGDLGNFFSIGAISIGIAYFIIHIYCTNMIIRDELCSKRNAFSLNQLPLIGLSLLVLPAVIISLSPKYQMALVWGIGYLPVYISYFGLIMITTYVVHMIYSKLNHINKKSFQIILPVFALILVILAGTTYSNNITAVENSNLQWLYPREIVEKSEENGLFKSIPNGSVLLVDSNYPWDQPAFYRTHSSSNFKSILVSTRQAPYIYDGTSGYISNQLPKNASINRYKDVYRYNFSSSDNIFYLKYSSDSANEGYAILGSIKDLSISNENIYCATTRDVFIYVHYSLPSVPFPAKRIFVIGQLLNEETNLFEPVMLGEEEMDLISSGKGWKLFHINKKQGLLDIMSLNIEVNSNYIESSIFFKDLTNNSSLLKSNKYEVLHVGFEHGFINRGVKLEPVNMNNKSFSIEVIVKPFKDQVAYAGIIGNHPGYNGTEGFVIQQDGKNINTYYYSFGNGKEWSHPIKFKLNEGEWNYLVIVVNKDNIDIYNNGLIVNSSQTKSSILNSKMPIYIGNWINNDRTFSGRIYEIRIVNSSKSNEDILSNWNYIQKYIESCYK